MSDLDSQNLEFTGVYAHPLVGLTRDYLLSRSYMGQRHAAEDIHSYGGPQGRAISAYASVDIVGTNPQIDGHLKDELLDQAGQWATEAVNSSDETDFTVTAKIKAMVLLADLPLYRAMFSQERYPTLQEVEDSFEANVDALSLALASMKHHPLFKDGVQNDTLAHINGTMTEIAIKNIANWYVIHELKSTGQVAVQSLYSQDNSRVKNPKSNPWDVSVYCSSSDDPDQLAYRVQSRTGIQNVERPNSETITVTPYDFTDRQYSIRGVAAHTIRGRLRNTAHKSKTLLDEWSSKLTEILDR